MKWYFVSFLVCIIRGMVSFVLSTLESLAVIHAVIYMNERKPVPTVML